jgi:Skp family chaperone for outer membrane proteins
MELAGFAGFHPSGKLGAAMKSGPDQRNSSMKRIALTALFVAACVFVTEAQPIAKPETEGSGRIGTIDTQKLAHDLGWDREMNDNLGRMGGEMEGQFKQLGGMYDSLIQQKKKEYGVTGNETMEEINKKMTPVQQREMMELVNKARQELTQVQQYAKGELDKYRNEWLAQYGDAVRPFVRRIAQDKRLSVVINTQQIPMMYTDPAVDITNAVVDAVLANPPKLTPVAPPKMISDLFQHSTTQSTTMPSTRPSSPGSTNAPAGGTGTGSPAVPNRR